MSWIFAGLVALRRRLYRLGLLRSYEVGCPVAVVGNLTVGGSGKTPLTLWLATRLRERGVRVGIVLRGYGRQGDKPRLVAGDARYTDVGDEALLLARRGQVPVAVGADRAAAARLLVEQGVEIVLSDDGLQHLRLRRDLEVVVIDGARRFGNGRLLPAGPLREPARRLANADAIVVNGAALSAGEISMVLQPGNAIPLSGAAPRPLSSFAGESVHAVAAIGNPERFFRMLEGQGIEAIRHPFPDHYALQRTDIEFPDNRPVLMTQKDAVKCEGFAGPRHWSVAVDAVLREEDGRRLLDKVLALRLRA